jgi:hypothetical protein
MMRVSAIIQGSSVHLRRAMAEEKIQELTTA